MKFSEQWLRELAASTLPTADLGHQLTMAGLEVDAVEPVAGKFSGIVVGHIVECEQHPDADKLRVTKVDAGTGELLQVVCGAPNARVGIKVPFAMIGAELPGLAIKKAKLRGVESFGMLCSARELGMSEDHAGLLELPADAPVGQDLRAWLKLDDNSIELGLTPNRGDCLGHLGVAREMAVLNKLPLAMPDCSPVAPGIDEVRTVTLKAPAACPRYLGRVIRGIDRSATTPLWMVEKLRRAGLRAISPCVDVTNYLLLELGHPMHAFDLNEIEGGIVVRLPEAGETLTLLDGKTVELQADTLLIADDKKPLALAGIMGGEHSGIADGSTDIFLEAAFFHPLHIAGRARRYGLHTDASHRYERGVDPALQRAAMERATRLLLDIVGGRAGPIVEAVSEEHLPKREAIFLRRGRIARILGATLPDAEVVDILSRLGMQVEEAGEGWSVVPPSWRFDMAIEVDLIEELARVHGYNELPTTPPLADLSMSGRREQDLDARRFRDVLVARGYQEAITFSFVDAKLIEQTTPGVQGLALMNPISADLGVMRTSVLQGLLKAAIHNQNRQQNRIRFVETGLRFVPETGGLKQEPVLAGLIMGPRLPESWAHGGDKVDFFDLKADVEALQAATGAAGEFRFVPGSHPALHPGQCAELKRGEATVGFLGALHPELVQKLDLNSTPYVFELALPVLSQGGLPAFKPLSAFPAVRRDLAVIVDEAVSAQALSDAIRAAAGELLQDLKVFDVYRGKGVDSGRKSVALGLTLQDSSRTLNDAEVTEIIEKVVGTLGTGLGATLRD
ncbi:MAG: phenylalanine--tRNA ligase subunit beta [Gammaproteobacteria bacterium]|nr:phenylalanine--tRNA ligase subunit beta [Gammaproteobacteria bacterium]